MDFIRGYVHQFTDFVAHAMEDSDAEEEEHQPNEALDPSVESADRSTIPVEESEDKSIPDEEAKGHFDWMKRPTTENALVYYLNTLTNFGNPSTTDDMAVEEKGTSQGAEQIITQEVKELIPSDEVNVAVSPPPMEDCISQSEDLLLKWVDTIGSRTEEVWKQIKQDLSEVVQFVSGDSKQVAASVREKAVAVARAARGIDPNQFILPDRAAEESTAKDDDSDESSARPPPSDVPSLEVLRADVSQLMSGLVSSLFGQSERPVDRREAQLQILRADESTYTNEPPSPPPGCVDFAAWRSDQFDEEACGPRSSSSSTEPAPGELLARHPCMQAVYTRLVPSELSASEFWARYHYRVWVLDARRRRLEEMQALGQKQKEKTAGEEEEEDDDWQDADVGSLGTARTGTLVPPPVDASSTTTSCSSSSSSPSKTTGEKTRDKRRNRRRPRRNKQQSTTTAGEEGKYVKEIKEQTTKPVEVDELELEEASDEAARSVSPEPAQPEEPVITSGSSSVIVLSESEHGDPPGSKRDAFCVCSTDDDILDATSSKPSTDVLDEDDGWENWS